MIRILVVFGLAIAACNADAPVTPPRVICGAIPENVFSCLGHPKLVKPEVYKQCTGNDDECDQITCIYQKSEWMKGNTVDLKKIESYFDQYAKDHPEWSTAVQQVKTGCLTTQLPPQGAFLNCPAYDVSICIITAFVKNAQPSQWSTSSDCTYTKQIAASCPLCPESCFATLIPTGSCNACKALSNGARAGLLEKIVPI